MKVADAKATATPAVATPAVSVIIVSFSRPDYLRDCLAALRFQTLGNFEVIVVSNTPPSEGGTSVRHRYYDFQVANISAARNFGLTHVRAPLVAFCDDDCIPDPVWLIRLIAPFYRDDCVGASGGYCRGRNGISYQWKSVGFGADGFDVKIPSLRRGMKIYPADHRPYIKTIGTNCAFRMAALAKTGGFDEGLRFFLDEADLNLRLQNAGWKPALVRFAEVHHITAESAYRNHKRKPRNLDEIAASFAIFTQKTLTTKEDRKAARAAFKQAQIRRLKRLYSYGRLSTEDMNRLIQSVDEGFTLGLKRNSDTPRLSPPTTSLGALVPIMRDESTTPKIFIDFVLWPRDARIAFDIVSDAWVLKCGYGGRFRRRNFFRAGQTRARLTRQVHEFLAERFREKTPLL